MKIIITGVAGFIGMHVAESLLIRGEEVIGIDNINDYYDTNLKKARLERLKSFDKFIFYKTSIDSSKEILQIFKSHNPQKVIHLAAQAGVRYSITNPHAYIDANIVGFMNILEAGRNHEVAHLTYASSSSVYGGNTKMPFSEYDNVDHPVSLYAATKKANELMAHTYSHLYNLPTTGLRFFTVYGPWGRPDMALFLFTKSIIQGIPIDVFNNGFMTRDFTFIDDIVEGVIRVSDKTAIPHVNYNSDLPDPSSSNVPYRIFNIGNSNPTPLMDYIGAIERALGKEAIKNYLPMQMGDVLATSADTDELNNWIGFKPNTSIDEGVSKFVKWYTGFYS